MKTNMGIMLQKIEENKLEDALDEVFRTITKLCYNNNWIEIDEILKSLNLNELPKCIIIAFAMSTYPVRDKLLHRGPIDEIFQKELKKPNERSI
jgi:hypothetical protein